MSNKIQYRHVGDYLIPNLILPPEEAKVTLGKWGIMHKHILKSISMYSLTHCLCKVSFISTVLKLRGRLVMCLILSLNK